MSDPAPAVTPAVVPGDDANAPAELPGHKVFAGNLAYSTTDEGLKAFFNPVASDIVSTQIIYRGTRSAGYGFVAFNSAEAAQKAVDLLNKKDLDGRTLIVEVAKPAEEKQKEKKQKKAPKKRNGSKKGRVNDAPPATADANASPSSDKAGENAEGQAKPKKKRNTRKTKKAKATATEGDAAPATTTDTTTAPITPAEPKPKKVKAPKPPKVPRPIGETPAGEPSKTMLFVANLGFSVDDAALATLFTDAGITVTSARVVRRRWGQPRRSKGYGFVDVGSEDQQKKALELLQGKTVDGREIAVKIAVNAQVKEADEAGANATEATAPAIATANAA